MADTESVVGWERRRVDEELRDIRNLLGETVPRREMQLALQSDSDARSRMQTQLDKLTESVERFKDEVRKEFQLMREQATLNQTERLRGLPPSWTWPVLAIVVPVLMAIGLHYWK